MFLFQHSNSNDKKNTLQYQWENKALPPRNDSSHNVKLRWSLRALTILIGKKLFYSIQYKNSCLAASDLFHMLTQSIKFYTLYAIITY